MMLRVLCGLLMMVMRHLYGFILILVVRDKFHDNSMQFCVFFMNFLISPCFFTYFYHQHLLSRALYPGVGCFHLLWGMVCMGNQVWLFGCGMVHESTLVTLVYYSMGNELLYLCFNPHLKYNISAPYMNEIMNLLESTFSSTHSFYPSYRNTIIIKLSHLNSI